MAHSNKNVYILSLEASDIYSHINRGLDFKQKYCGMIPYSLELMKLQKEGLNIYINPVNDKRTTRDIINVKFNCKAKDAYTIIQNINSKIRKTSNDSNSDYINKLDTLSSLVEQHKEDWTEVSNQELREILYTKGFTLSFTDKKTSEIIDIRYCAYKRLSSKSSTGQCLFIKEELYKTMINSSRMYLPLIEEMQLDYPGLLAYESLVGSAIENKINIDPKNILIIDDIKHQFKQQL